MRDTKRAARATVTVRPKMLGRFTNEQGLWHESEEEIAEGIRRAKETARLLRWVRAQMNRRLTPTERRAVHMYYLKGLKYAEIASKTGMSPSSAQRAVARALRKLRQAAAENPPPTRRLK